ncbi:MAG: oligosaccharide flippase family protein [Candidatus Anstonellales archaeon]
MVYKEASVNTIRTVITILSSLLFAIIIFRTFQAEEVGTYYFWLSITIIVSIIFNIPYSTLLYLIPKDLEKSKKILTSTVIVTFLLSFLVLIFIFKTLGFEDYIILSFLGSFIVITQLGHEIVFSAKMLKDSLLFTVISNLLKLLSLLLFIFFDIKTALSLFFATFISAVCWLIPIRKIMKLNEINFHSLSHVIELIKNSKEGFYLYLVNILTYINISVDTILAGIFLTAFDVGIYNIAGNIMRYVINNIPSSISFFIFPILLRSNKKGLLGLSLIIVNVFVLPFVIASIYPYPFVKLISGGYENHAMLLFYFLPAVICAPILYTLIRYALSQKDFFFVKYLALTGILNILLNYIAILYGFGINGLAMATSISIVVFSFILAYKMRSVLAISYSIKTIIAGIALTLLCYILSIDMPKSFENDAKALLYAVFFIALSFFVNAILIYILFINESKALLRNIFILLNKIKDYAMRRFSIT